MMVVVLRECHLRSCGESKSSRGADAASRGALDGVGAVGPAETAASAPGFDRSVGVARAAGMAVGEGGSNADADDGAAASTESNAGAMAEGPGERSFTTIAFGAGSLDAAVCELGEAEGRTASQSPTAASKAPLNATAAITRTRFTR